MNLTYELWYRLHNTVGFHTDIVRTESNIVQNCFAKASQYVAKGFNETKALDLI